MVGKTEWAYRNSSPRSPRGSVHSLDETVALLGRRAKGGGHCFVNRQTRARAQVRSCRSYLVFVLLDTTRCGTSTIILPLANHHAHPQTNFTKKRLVEIPNLGQTDRLYLLPVVAIFNNHGPIPSACLRHWIIAVPSHLRGTVHYSPRSHGSSNNANNAVLFSCSPKS